MSRCIRRWIIVSAFSWVTTQKVRTQQTSRNLWTLRKPLLSSCNETSVSLISLTSVVWHHQLLECSLILPLSLIMTTTFLSILVQSDVLYTVHTALLHSFTGMFHSRNTILSKFLFCSAICSPYNSFRFLICSTLTVHRLFDWLLIVKSRYTWYYQRE